MCFNLIIVIRILSFHCLFRNKTVYRTLVKYVTGHHKSDSYVLRVGLFTIITQSVSIDSEMCKNVDIYNANIKETT